MKLNMKTNRFRKAGFTLVEIMIVVAVIGLLASIAIPNFIRARTTAQMNGCINNLRQIDAAIQQYTLENNLGSGSPVVALDITPYLGRGLSGSVAGVVCPADMAGTFDTSYTLVDTSTQPSCAIVPANHLIN